MSNSSCRIGSLRLSIAFVSLVAAESVLAECNGVAWGHLLCDTQEEAFAHIHANSSGHGPPTGFVKEIVLDGPLFRWFGPLAQGYGYYQCQQRTPNMGIVGCATGESTSWRTLPSTCSVTGSDVTCHDAFDQAKSLGEQCEASAPPTTCGNPIDSATGNKFQRETDIEGIGLLRFDRFYNSQSTAEFAQIGWNWSHTYSRRVEAVNAGLVHVHRPDGRRLSYRLDVPTGEWRADADIKSGLLERLDTSGNRIGWEYLETDARKREVYDTLGRLQSIQGSDGRSVTIVHNGGTIENNADDYLVTLVTGQDGRTISFAYNWTSRRLTSVTGPDGQVISYDYDSSARLQNVDKPGPGARTYVYNESSRTAGFDYPTALTGIIDENGDRYATFEYGNFYKAVSTERDDGISRHAIAFNADGTSTVTTPLGSNKVRSFSTHHGIRKLTQEVESCSGCLSRTTSYTYDANGRLDTVIEPSGLLLDYDFDGAGRLLEKVEASPSTSQIHRTTQIEWHSSFAVPVERLELDENDALVTKQTWTYNNRGQVLTSSQVDPLTSASRTTTYSYCEAADVAATPSSCPILGQLKSINGPRTDVTDSVTLTYRGSDNLSGCATGGACHRKGDLYQITNAAGLVTTYNRYDLAGRVRQVTDTNGVATDLEYNASGWLTARKVRGANNSVESDDAITLIEYDNVGQVLEASAPDGSTLTFTYDQAHRLTGIEDALGNTVTYTLDAAGNLVEEKTRDAGTALRHSLSRLYNELGQLETFADALYTPSDFTYDAAGNLDTVTDALGRVTNNDYDALGRLRESIANTAGSGATRPVTGFAYDARDNLVAVTDPKGLDTTYTYDGLNDLVEIDSPDTGVTEFAYDNAGNRTAQTDARGVELVYAYDELNRLTELRSWPNQPGGGRVLAAFEYDTAPTECLVDETFGAGRLAGFTDESGYTRYCHDRRGNVVRKVQSTSLQLHTLAYSYTAADRLNTVTYPSGLVVTYIRNAAGQITAITANSGVRFAPTVDLVTSVGYLPFGPVTSLTFGNGRVLDKDFDQNYGIDAVADNTVDGIDIHYTLDDAGKVTGLTERTQSGSTASRTVWYDDVDRLTALKNGSTTVQGFDYDATGNRMSKTQGASEAYTYASTSHRLTQTGSTVRTYDAAGNTSTTGSKTFTYDDRGRLSEYGNGSSQQQYRYNAKGERVARLDVPTPAGDLHFVYGEAGHLMGEYTSAGVLVKEYIWLDDTLVAVRSDHVASEYQYVLTDHLNTPRALVLPGTDDIIWRWDLTGSAFGDHAAQDNPDGDAAHYTFNLRYPGQYLDVATGLHYNYFRDYDPSTGRYVQSDPIGQKGGTGTYPYVGAAPFNSVDPLGLFKVESNYVENPSLSFYEQLQSRKAWSNGTAMGARENALREMSSNMESYILSRCSGDALDKILSEFRAWRVRVDPKIDTLGRYNGDYGLTSYYGRNTTLYSPYFLADSPVQMLTMFHEFRHLSSKNHALKTPGSGARALVSGGKDVPFEQDAEQWAEDMMKGECGCDF